MYWSERLKGDWESTPIASNSQWDLLLSGLIFIYRKAEPSRERKISSLEYYCCPCAWMYHLQSTEMQIRQNQLGIRPITWSSCWSNSVVNQRSAAPCNIALATLFFLRAYRWRGGQTCRPSVWFYEVFWAKSVSTHDHFIHTESRFDNLTLALTSPSSNKYCFFVFKRMPLPQSEE